MARDKNKPVHGQGGFANLLYYLGQQGDALLAQLESMARYRYHHCDFRDKDQVAISDEKSNATQE